jgi:uncharacterized protein YdaU (DUF1376 family)
MHLTRVERALYRDLIELYYDTEQPLPSVDFNRLARRVRATDEQELIALQYVLDEFFILTGDSYSHDFCDEQIDKFHNTTTLKAKAGKASAEARKKKAEARKSVRKNTNEQVLNTCSTEGQQNPTNHEPVTSNHEPIIKTCPEPSSQDLSVIEIATNKFNKHQEIYPVKQSQLDDWQEAYPAVDVMQTLNRIKSWCSSNPTKRKTMTGMSKFIDTWLAKNQNEGSQNNETNSRANARSKSGHANILQSLKRQSQSARG